MSNKFNPKAKRTNLHLSAQCKKQIAEIRKAAVDADELMPTVAAVIGDGVAILHAQLIGKCDKAKQEGKQ